MGDSGQGSHSGRAGEPGAYGAQEMAGSWTIYLLRRSNGLIIRPIDPWRP